MIFLQGKHFLLWFTSPMETLCSHLIYTAFLQNTAQTPQTRIRPTFKIDQLIERINGVDAVDNGISLSIQSKIYILFLYIYLYTHVNHPVQHVVNHSCIAFVHITKMESFFWALFPDSMEQGLGAF